MMSYKEKFDASEGLAHSQLVATKMLRDLEELRAKIDSSTTTRRRWVWELIQNAKDVHPEGGVKINIEFATNASAPHVTFRHNGKPFTTDNIRFLIEQISTKDRKKSEEGRRKATGKFGTGFLTTHMLSEIVTIEAIAKEPNLDYRKFVLKLDRTGLEPEQITDAVITAKKSVMDMDTWPAYKSYVEGDLNTAFKYPLQTPANINVAEEGLTDIENCLPYALVFVPEIESVKTLPQNIIYKRKALAKQINDFTQVVSVAISEKASFHVLVLTKGYTSIVVPIKKEGDFNSFDAIGDAVPRLFCDFPLIGTEKFPFPVIINNPNFNPTDPRDGIFLTSAQQPTVEENKVIMLDAVELYFQLLEFASENEFKNMHLLAQVQPLPSTSERIDPKWFKKEVADPIREKLLYTPIVYTASGGLISIMNEGDPHAWFPSASKKEIREQIWASANFWFPEKLPTLSDIELWNKISWSECGWLTVSKMAQFISLTKDIETLSSQLKSIDVMVWLNSFYELAALEEKDYDSIINKQAIFPNQHGVLCLKEDLYKDAGNIEEDFKDIMTLLGNDVKSYLADQRVQMEFSEERTVDQAYVVKEITSEVTEKTNDREVAKSFGKAFQQLLLWIRENQSKADKLFPSIIKQLHLLYDDETIMENMTKSARFDKLLAEFKIKSIDELRDILQKKNSEGGELLPITQEIITSMGIQSLEEWAEAIKDKDLKELFKHESVPTTDMFIFAQSLISKAKAAIVAFLDKHNDYDTVGLQETAPTILAGILKLGQPVTIVVRPAYNGEVIIYYGSEKDVLDYDDQAELWVDTGLEVKKITLGHILKTGQIRKFPI